MAWTSTADTSTAGSWRNQRPRLIPEKCTGCNVCWKFCPEPAITIVGKKVDFELDVCKGCGVCAEVCAPEAIEMVPEESA
jgi:2-oxoacid:acceptor oxidoreductase delta subunit (pyruvate/2-ketoisovalerate family)